MRQVVDDLPLFSAVMQEAPECVEMPEEAAVILDLLDETNPDELTPRQALELLYRLKAMRGGG